MAAPAIGWCESLTRRAQPPVSFMLANIAHRYQCHAEMRPPEERCGSDVLRKQHALPTARAA
ncbi:hypothetical protein BSLA_01f2523 [Burkholderia stabilis]|nr:hypothetical protein BSLA_01f2523 [Burkholderia stabilis]